jgi:hypothetical protein
MSPAGGCAGGKDQEETPAGATAAGVSGAPLVAGGGGGAGGGRDSLGGLNLSTPEGQEQQVQATPVTGL